MAEVDLLFEFADFCSSILSEEEVVYLVYWLLKKPANLSNMDAGSCFGSLVRVEVVYY